MRLDASRIETRDIEQRIEQIAQRRERHSRLMKVIEVETGQAGFLDGFQEQQRGAQRLTQIVAGRREEAGLRLIRPICGFLGLLQGELYFAPRLELRLEAQIQLLILLRSLPDGFLEACGGLKPGELAALLIDRLLDAEHERLDRFLERAILGRELRGGLARPLAGSLRRRGLGARLSADALRRFLHGTDDTPRQVKELFACTVLNCSPSEEKPTTELRFNKASMPALKPSRCMYAVRAAQSTPITRSGAPMRRRMMENSSSRLAIMSPGRASATTSPGSSAQANSRAPSGYMRCMPRG